jgi:hypothetical protein
MERVSRTERAHASPAKTLKLASSSGTPNWLKKCLPSELRVTLHAVIDSTSAVYRRSVPCGVVAIVLSSTLADIRRRERVHPVANEVPMSNDDPPS